jgi:hypothetical protein
MPEFNLGGYEWILIFWGLAFEVAGFVVAWLVFRGIRLDAGNQAERAAELNRARTQPVAPEEPKRAA